MKEKRNLVCALIAFWLIGFCGRVAQAQQPLGQDGFVELNLSGTVSLPQLVEALAKQLGVRFLYGTDLANRTVTVYTPAKLPKSALPTLLGSLLKAENLAVVNSDVPGWKRIVDVADMVSFAQSGDANEVLKRDGPAAAVTQVIPIKNADITKLAATLRPFLSKTGSSFIPLPQDKLVIVTDYARNVQRIVELLRLIDQPVGKAKIDFYVARNRNPSSLIEQATKLLESGTDAQKKSINQVRLFNDTSGSRVVVAGDKDRVAETLQLLQQLDTGTDFLTKVYRPQNIGAERLDRLIRGFVSKSEAETAIESTVDQEGNLLIVRAAAIIHRQITTLLDELDRPVDSNESPIRFYKLKNANAIEVLFSLLALQQVTGSGQQQGGLLGQGAFGTLGGLNVGGVNQLGGLGVQQPGLVNGVNPFGTGNQRIRLPFGEQQNPNGNANSNRGANQNQGLSPLISQAGGGINGFGAAGALGGGGAGTVATLPGGARVSADVATNSLIVYAPSNVQPLYEKLIQSLDQRRPQVLIEAEIVAVDTSDNYSLGVEVSGGDRSGARRLFKFTSFGLSEVDPTSGALSISPSLGFNGVLVDPDVADVIVQALASHNRSRVLASPQILVNDNQEGTLESVSSVSFQSINTINTISSQSLGGSQQAGTLINVTPHINEDDHLQLEFEVEFSTFVGSGTDTLPPPRQIDRVGSVVTIPDGKTVVVGGLKRIDGSGAFTGLPILEKIPVLRELTSLQSTNESTTSFFLFIRPTILRDSRFRDLQYLSQVQSQKAQLPGDYPTSRPMLIKCPNPPVPRTIHRNHVHR